MNTFQRYLVEEFAEEYQEGRMSRQQALKLIASVLGGLTVAQTFLAGCAPPPAATAPPATDDPVATHTAVAPTADIPRGSPLDPTLAQPQPEQPQPAPAPERNVP